MNQAASSRNYLVGEKERTKGGESEVHKKKIPASITIYDAPGSGGETPVRRDSGPSLESEKTKDKANVGRASSTVEGGRSEVVSFAASGSGAKRDDVLGKEFWKAVDGRNFEWLKENLRNWWGRKDLLDDVIRRGADFTVWFIQSVKDATRCVLAALFDKGDKEMIDIVLGGIKYSDEDLIDLTRYRRELVSSPEKFFRVLDKVKNRRMTFIGVSENWS